MTGLALTALALAAAVTRRRRPDAGLWLVLLLGAAGWTRTGLAHEVSQASLARASEGERRVLLGIPVEAEVIVLRRPALGARDWYFPATLRAVRRGRVQRSTHEPLLVFAATRPVALREGNRVRLWLTLRPPDEPGGPLLARLKHPDLVVGIHAQGGLAALSGACRAWAADRLEQGLRRGGATEDARNIALALALGDRDSLSDATAERLRRSGLSHLLAVSGMNVAVVIAAFGAGARLGGCAPAPLMVLHLLTGIGYTLLLPAGSPVARAGLMALAAPIGRLIGRPARGLELLGAAALILLLLDPGAWREPSFGLSFTVTAFLLRGFERPSGDPPLRRGVIELGLQGCWLAALGALPLGVAYFGELTPGGVLLNLVAVPLGSVLLLTAVLAAAAAAIHPWAAAPAALVLEPGVLLLLGVADLIDRLPLGRLLVPTVAPCAAALSLALLFAAIDRRRRGRWRLCAAAAAIAILGAASLTGLRPLPSGALSVRLLDVGQGDAVLVGLPGGGALLVDGGRPASTTRAAALRGLAVAGRRRLTALVLSHDHLDHVGGLPPIAREIAVGEIWLPGLTPRSAALQQVLDEADARHIPVRVLRSGERLWRSGALITCLHPARLGPRRGPNDDSMVLVLEGPAGRILLTGDLDGTTERSLAEARLLKPVEILKIPHHGSRNSATPELLEGTRPRVALISAGRRNPWGHPHPDTLDRLRRLRIPVLSTARHGTLTIALRPHRPRLEFSSAFLDEPVGPP